MGSKGNRNALVHGKYAYLAVGRLPPGASYIRRLLGAFQRATEAAVVEAHGEIPLTKAALIQSAVRHEGRAQLLTRWLRESDLSLAERLAVLKEIGGATDARDRCLKLLDLDRQDAHDPATIYAELRRANEGG